MNLDPALSKPDRIGSLVAGVAVVAMAFFGSIDNVGLKVVVAILGVMLVIGGIGGT